MGNDGRVIVSPHSCEAQQRDYGWCECRWAAPADRGFGLEAIGTDIHRCHLTGLRPDLPTVMSRFVMPGLPLREVIRLVTSRVAILGGKADEIGSLRPGLAADVTMLRWTDGEFALREGDGAARTMTCLLVLQLMVRAGLVIHSDPAHGAAGGS